MGFPVTIPGGSTWEASDFDPFSYPESFPEIIKEFIDYAESTEAVEKAAEAAVSAAAAVASAGVATGAAGTATAASGTATSAAGTATTKAAEADDSADAAAASAATATTQAGIATTGAGTATSQAAISTASAVASTQAKDAALVAQAAASASAVGAATSATNGAASAASASTSATLAAASAGVAGSGAATTLLYPALSKAIVTASDLIDAVVLDCRMDTDGGGWRGKSEHASWFAATLNTATRGATRPFPLMSTVTLRSGTTATVQIGDLGDLDGSGVPRMWWILARSTGGLLDGTPTAVSARQGRVCVTTSTGLYIYDFPNDRAFRHDAAGLYRWSGGIMTAGAWQLVAASGAIVSATANHVSLAVLPGAALDAAGLPIPTVAVATAGGISVIHPNGAVYDISRASGHSRVIFLTDGSLRLSLAGAAQVEDGPIPYADVSNSSWRSRLWETSSAPAILLGANKTLAGEALGGSGLTLLSADTASAANGMVATVTIAHATGWQPGDIRLATLCDGATGSLTGSTELATNGDFATDLTGWTATAGGAGAVAQSSGTAAITGDGTSASTLDGSITTVVGQAYLLVVDVTTSAVNISIGTSAGGAQVLASASYAVGKALIPFLATATTTWLRFSKTAAATTNIDNVSVKLAVADRSYKGKGLIPVGTLSRTAVATGSDMVAFSGFSAANYLTQPYNPDYDFADADFSVMGWFRCSATAALETLIMRDSPTTGARFGLQIAATSSVLNFVASDGTDTVTVSSTSAVDDGVNHFVAACMRGTTMELWIDGTRVATGSASAVDSISNSLAQFRVGVDGQGANPLASGFAWMVRTSAYAPSPAQFARIYRDEMCLVQPDAKCFIGGISNIISDMDFDSARNVLIFGTGDGASEFSGLMRTAYLDTASVPGSVLSNDNMKAVSAQAGFRLFAGSSQAVAYRDAVNGLDTMNRYGPRSLERFLMRAVTNDATPTNLVPRIFVGEREVVRVRATVTARQNGAAGTERASYDIVTQAYRDAGGNVTLDIAAANQGVAGWGTAGPAAITRATETTSTMDAVWVVDTASQTLTVQVTGKAATRLEWTASNIAIERITNETLYAPVAA